MLNLRLQLLALPDKPGIYLFYNRQKELVYVGKATSLKNRVRSYFRLKKITRPIEAMMHEVVTIKFKTTDSVLEAVILEANYIKRYLPRYNVLGKDNRSWNYIVITKDEYPQIKTLRQHEYELLHKGKISDEETMKNIKYIFGPYPGLNTKAAMKILRQLFHFSTCKPGQKRPCFYYQMGQCYGVCAGLISPTEYKRKVIQPLVYFLRGEKKKLVESLEKRMKAASKKEDYEEAGRIRDQLKSLYRIQDITLINKSMVSLDGWEQEAKKENPSSKLPTEIRRIEGYDISNLGTSGKVGSMVVFDTAGPVKSEYRKFKIRGVEGQSDVDCLEEVIRRRFSHSEWQRPDIVLIDGGRPQVNRIDAVLRDMHILLPIVGIAKGPERKKNEFTFPNSFFDDSVQIARDVLEQRRTFVQWVNEHQGILIQTRDEAHRFAITYQRKTRKLR